MTVPWSGRSYISTLATWSSGGLYCTALDEIAQQTGLSERYSHYH